MFCSRCRIYIVAIVLALRAATAPVMRAADESPPPILQWFDSTYRTIENRMPDLFVAGYGFVWVPPPFRADTGNSSVGYDVYDRFDLGGPGKPTLYGTEEGLKSLARMLHRAGLSLHVDFVLNHNGFSNLGTKGFVAAGGYPGFVVTLPNDIDGDFHSAFAGGVENERLAGLIDIAHDKNHQFIRSPVAPNNP
jgi:alpha-amylase